MLSRKNKQLPKKLWSGKNKCINSFFFNYSCAKLHFIFFFIKSNETNILHVLQLLIFLFLTAGYLKQTHTWSFLVFFFGTGSIPLSDSDLLLTDRRWGFLSWEPENTKLLTRVKRRNVQPNIPLLCSIHSPCGLLWGDPGEEAGWIPPSSLLRLAGEPLLSSPSSSPSSPSSSSSSSSSGLGSGLALLSCWKQHLNMTLWSYYWC